MAITCGPPYVTTTSSWASADERSQETSSSVGPNGYAVPA